ncbi:hypothetical protein PCANC_16602 [Puccinia coronata f. sp. avenae]|uniref:Uncharacterized protein n=1 Tax=Puccinia coronata f. sp. avenae TaxID=200324 RepID=A0A2N5S6I2_9BASI|nr:hypothetical protein PCANC_16602 [Puccinia coronata f. sp. avenae]PLW43318.1 hypothetical protein PCASD_06141 [Puccinia coronata f. sp. avenae]
MNSITIGLEMLAGKSDDFQPYGLSFLRRIRIFFVVEKVFAVAGIFGLVFMITQYSIRDQVTNNEHQSF